jgi:transcription initiation factor TFIID subunit 11
MGKKKRKERPVDSSDEEVKSKRVKEQDLESTSKEEEETTESENEAQEDSNREDMMKLLVSAFSEKQHDQYEIFRRAAFPRARIKSLMQSICGVSIPPNAIIAMAGIAKVYVGEIVELACETRDKSEEEGPLRPKHIREAARKLKQRDAMPLSKCPKTLF